MSVNNNQQVLSKSVNDNQRVLSKSDFSQGVALKSPFSVSRKERERNQRVLSQGAEAVIYLEGNLVIKDRISKSYRIKELDDKIRKRRTKSEKKLLEKASKIINAPDPFPLKEETKIKMPFIDGKKLSQELDNFQLAKQKEICKLIGKEIAKLHEADIIHGDLTTSNMILVENNHKIDKENNYRNHSSITFPKDEWEDIKSRLNEDKIVYTIRVSKDYGKFREGEIVETEWGSLVKILSVKKIKGGISELKNQYKYFKELSKERILELERYDKMEIIKLTKFQRRNLAEPISKQYQSASNMILTSNQFRKYNNFPLGWEGGNKRVEFQIFFIDFGLGFISKKIEDKAVDLHLLKQALEAKHFRNWEVLFKEVLKGYSNYSESKKVIERITAIERRGRYRH